MSPRDEPFLSDVLRAATADAHARLESVLDLLTPPLSQPRFIHALARFHGFHRAWEPALRQAPDCAAMMHDRSRMDALHADLRALGRSDAEIDALPICSAAAALCLGPGARGSCYVMEGSTLGGQLIARALAQAPWAPPGGLGYFTPYGQQTGVRWRAFKAWLDETPPQDWPAVTAGAISTFDALRIWLGAGAPERADLSPLVPGALS